MRLILVRHGDAYAGLHGTIAGPRGCRGLTPLGRRQAAALAERIAAGPTRPDVLVASELPRAIETAEIVGRALDVDAIPRDCDLCEVHTGEADGTDWKEYTERHGTLDMMALPDQRFAPGGDSWNSFNARVESLMDRLAATYPDETVMAFTHAGLIMATLRIRLALGPTTDGALLRPTNTGLTTWSHDAATGRWGLDSYNDHHHLDRVLER